jgi:hypothetical protein
MCPWAEQFLSKNDEAEMTCDRTRMPTNASSGWKGVTYISYHSSGPILAAIVLVVSLENIVPFFAL